MSFKPCCSLGNFKEFQQLETLRALFAEFVALVLFVFVGCGAAVSTGTDLRVQDTAVGDDVARILPIAVAFGFGIVLLAYSTAHLSGAHINPAVTLGVMMHGGVSVLVGLMYMVVQFLGGMVGAALVWGATSGLTKSCDSNPDSPACVGSSYVVDNQTFYGPPFFLGANSYGNDITGGNAFCLEFVGTFLLMFVVSMTAVDTKSAAQNKTSMAPMAIGITVLVVHIVLIPFTGCGINPARTFGPDVVISGAGVPNVWDDQWVYYVGPWLGAACAVVVSWVVIVKDPAPLASQPGESTSDDDGAETTDCEKEVDKV